MRDSLLFLASVLLCGCSLPEADSADSAPQPAAVLLRAEDLPAGTIYRTSRKAAFDALCEELGKADVVYLGESQAESVLLADQRQLELQIIRQLRAATRLDAIGLAALARPHQSVLDEYSRGTIEWAQLTARIGGIDIEGYRPILEFAREHRLGIVALDVAPDVLIAVMAGGRKFLTEEQLRDLPEESDSIAGYDEFVQERALLASAATGDSAEPFARSRKLRDDVLADTVVQWLRASPPKVQMAVIAGADRIAHPWGMAARVRARSGRLHLSVVLLDESPPPSHFARSYADFIFAPGE